MKEYSKFSLSPLDKELRKRFMAFRNEDVLDMYIYPCIIASVGIAVTLIALVFLQTKALLIQLSMQTFNVIAYWLIWLLGKRFKDKMAYLVAFSYIVIHVIALLVAQENIEIKNEERTSVSDGLGMTSKICSSFVIYTLLLAPTIWHVVLVYVPGFIISILHFIHRHAQFEDLLIVVALYMIIVLVIAWYIF